jgi:hypothetical protein
MSEMNLRIDKLFPDEVCKQCTFIIQRDEQAEDGLCIHCWRWNSMDVCRTKGCGRISHINHKCWDCWAGHVCMVRAFTLDTWVGNTNLSPSNYLIWKGLVRTKSRSENTQLVA